MDRKYIYYLNFATYFGILVRQEECHLMLQDGLHDYNMFH
jgi:hypothetical protein